MTTRKDRNLAFIILVYALCRLIYWQNWNEYIYWDLFYHIAEKSLPIMIVLNYWGNINYKPIGIMGISIFLFFMIYSILYRYTSVCDYTANQITFSFVFYSVSILLITFIKRKQ
jgi:hypothetical protein